MNNNEDEKKEYRLLSVRNFARVLNKQARQERRLRRKERRKKFRRKIRTKIVQGFSLAETGVSTVTSYLFQKEIVLALTIFLTSWFNYKQYQKLDASLTDLKVEIARVETRLQI